MATIMREASSQLGLTQNVIVEIGSFVPIYGTVNGADCYFGSMLEGQKWAYTPRLQRFQALVSATKRIERLNFIGGQANPEQPLQFPRGTDTLVPVEIEHACYELALALLKGVDPDTEHDNLDKTVQAYGSLLSKMDRSMTPPHIKAGIPSATAWALLWHFLDPVRGLTIRRVS